MDEPKHWTVLTNEALPEPFQAAHDYWRDKAGTSWAPQWEDFKINELPPKLLPWSVVVDVKYTPYDFLYRFWGTSRARLIGLELTGKYTSDIADDQMREANIREYVQVCETREPLLCETPIKMSSGRRVDFQSIRMPLRNLDDRVSHIFSAVNYNDINEDHYTYFGTRPSGI